MLVRDAVKPLTLKRAIFAMADIEKLHKHGDPRIDALAADLREVIYSEKADQIPVVTIMGLLWRLIQELNRQLDDH